MNWLDKIERKCGRIAVPNLMFFIICGMFAVFLCELIVPELRLTYWMYLDRDLIFQGQVWRLLTFILIPTSTSPLWILFSLYFYYLAGSGLESQWGSFRFNFYYLIGMVGTIIAAMITGSADNTYLNFSLFFGFAALFPNFQVLLFFIIPIKIKYLAWLDALLFLAGFIFGTWSARAAILFSLVNFFLFFGGDFFRGIKQNLQYRKRQKEFRQYFKNQR